MARYRVVTVEYVDASNEAEALTASNNGRMSLEAFYAEAVDEDEMIGGER